MKRLWISFAILILIAALSVWSASNLSSVCSQLTEVLKAADQAVSRGDWESAQQLTEQAADQWEKKSTYLYMVVPHTFPDEITSEFYEVLALLRWQEGAEYTSANQRLIVRLSHLGRSEQLTLGNLF
jgi:hypothetical protein